MNRSCLTEPLFVVTWQQEAALTMDAGIALALTELDENSQYSKEQRSEKE
jgi:hypothetical protein